ncbi:hypothetical protein BGZ54_001753 [Gamsiella multidivaricata]|nr:hypothetical protein BGZ54_001753 [Gamsiella multidivaricata]
MATLQALKQRHLRTLSDDLDLSETDSNALFRDSKRIHSPTKVHSSFSPIKTVLRAWGLFVGFMALLVLITYQIHYTLPTPVHEPSNPVTGQVQFSEANVRKVVRHLSEDIGYRVVGTEQELETKKYLIKELMQLKDDARIARLRKQDEAAVAAAAAGTAKERQTDLAWPNFDMWVQVGDGSHRFDFMSKGK